MQRLSCAATYRPQPQPLNPEPSSHVQNLVDQMGQTFQQALPSERHSDLNTFVVFNQRRKVPPPRPAACLLLPAAAAEMTNRKGRMMLMRVPLGTSLGLRV